MGMKLLYGGNSYSFSMRSLYPHNNPSHQHAFLRFINTIGPPNATIIKNLTLSGTLTLHECRTDNENCKNRCEDNFARSLDLYLQFMKKFFTGLETLTLIARPEWHVQDRLEDPDDPLTPFETLRPILDYQLQGLSSLKKLQVFDASETVRLPLDVAKSAIEWFDQRTQRRAFEWNQHVSKLTSERAKDSPSGCSFCGEDHILAECWSLCNFYGDFSHFQEGYIKAED
ncbi:hypothetical protein BKA65DRAFT_483246 [Rhexocercosporidium sp. MPI-PUGE-AT-0058]|nr:hypothetical protein BKA65DRAFT_483246 [Rhexocercosporidium sp. MPI-PUGE-AT-0058]